MQRKFESDTLIELTDGKPKRASSYDVSIKLWIDTLQLFHYEVCLNKKNTKDNFTLYFEIKQDIMKCSFILISIVFFTIISSCKNDILERKVTCIQRSDYNQLGRDRNDSICTSALCTEYFNIWEKVFKEQNNMTDSFFDEHFNISSSTLYTWNDGISYLVGYEFQIGWATVSSSDRLMVKYSTFPGDDYLSEEEIRYAINIGSRMSKIGTFSTSKLLFTTIDDALNYLIETARVNTLCATRLYLDKSIGHLKLEAWGEYENEENSCIQGEIDLITGIVESGDTRCWIKN